MLPAIRNTNLSRTNGDSGRLSPLFEGLFGDFWPAFPVIHPAMSWPSSPTSIWEDENSVYVEMDAPGVEEGDIDLYVEGGMLIVRGERKSEHKENGYDARSYGRFEQHVRLPSTVDAGAIEARLSRGVLRVICSKSEEAKPRRIAVKSDE